MQDGNVVVIGGGYAGVRLAKRLDTTARVTLVDRKEVFFHRISSLRAGVRPDWTQTPFIPYDRLPTHGRLLVGKAIRIDTAGRQAMAAHNIRAYLCGSGRHEKKSRHYRAVHRTPLIVPFGSADGVTMIPVTGGESAVLGGRTTTIAKAKTLMTPYVRRQLGYAAS